MIDEYNDLEFLHQHFLRYLLTPAWPRRVQGTCAVTGRIGPVLRKKGSAGFPDSWIHEQIAPLYPRYKTPPKPGQPLKNHPNAGNTGLFKLNGAILVSAADTFATFNLLAWENTPITYVPEMSSTDMLLACYYDSFPALPRPEGLKLPRAIQRPFIYMPMANTELMAGNVRCTRDENLIDVCTPLLDIFGIVRIDIVEELRSRNVSADQLAEALDLIATNNEDDRKRLIAFYDAADIDDLLDDGLMQTLTVNELTLLKAIQNAEQNESKRLRRVAKVSKHVI